MGAAAPRNSDDTEVVPPRVSRGAAAAIAHGDITAFSSLKLILYLKQRVVLCIKIICEA
jgi:hypothetical protein